MVAGFVVMAVLVAPFLRKAGAFTLPSFLRQRFESRAVRLVAAAVVAVPMLLVLAAELRAGAFAASFLLGRQRRDHGGVLVLVLIATLVPAACGR